jgi:hypothetical protein
MTIAGRGDEGKVAKGRVPVDVKTPSNGQQQVSEAEVKGRCGDKWFGDG